MRTYSLYLFLFFFLSCNSDSYKLEWKVKDGNPICYGLFRKKLNVTEVKCLKDSFFHLENCNAYNKDLFEGSLYLDELIVIENDGHDCLEFNMESYPDYLNSGKKSVEHIIDVIDILLTFRKARLNIEAPIDKTGMICDDKGLDYKVRNCISLICQLPKKSVSKGDKWAINLSLDNNTSIKTVNENYGCNIRLDSVEIVDNTEIAHIFYDINLSHIFENKIPSDKVIENTELFLSFFGRAKFDITNGKWLYFGGVLEKKFNEDVSEKKNSEFINLIELSYLSELDSRLLDLGIDEKEVINDGILFYIGNGSHISDYNFFE